MERGANGWRGTKGDLRGVLIGIEEKVELIAKGGWRVWRVCGAAKLASFLKTY